MFGAHLKDEYEEGGGGEGQEGGEGCAHLGGAGLKWQWILPATYSAPSPSPPLFSQTVSLLQDILKQTLTKEVLRYNLSDKTLSSCF